ncbi:MAG: glycosyltransferase, partial [Clostridia bacterium]|nr:glycosyltransferase [Clostridia bacterium]
MDKKVTGCIVTHNNMGTIAQAIDSLLASTHATFELFVVDNGSTDGTYEFVQTHYPLITLLKTG